MGFVPVADGVLVRTSRRMSTTTTLVLGPSRAASVRAALLVDPAWEADELVAVADDVEALGARVVAGFSTHAHHDHLLWHPRYGAGVVRWASAATVRAVAERREALLAELTTDVAYPPEVLELFARVTPLPGDQVPDADSELPATRVIVHDAHASGHTALWLPDSGVLVVGDMLSDIEIPLPFDVGETIAELSAYLAGLDRLASWVAQARVLVPGHGTPSSRPVERLDADRRYLDAVLAGRRADDPRLVDPAMLAEHERVLRVVAGMHGRGGVSAQGREHRADRRRGEGDEHEGRQTLPERPDHG